MLQSVTECVTRVTHDSQSVSTWCLLTYTGISHNVLNAPRNVQKKSSGVKIASALPGKECYQFYCMYKFT